MNLSLLNLNSRSKAFTFAPMNFLAHTHLSGDNDPLLFGNFIADAVKGNAFNGFDAEIKKGILIHRKIDSFTDRHEIVKDSIKRVRPAFGKYAGIAVDIYYDHFLAANWRNYDSTDLSDFTVRVYKILARRFLIMPARTRRMLPFLIAQNWLNSYANLDDLKRIFYGMDRRTSFKSGMVDAVAVLKANYSHLQSEFEAYYPLLREYVENEIEQYEQNQ